MANAGRKYAEELVGALDRGAYNTQRDVTNQTYQTNWESLSNQYKNLQEKLKNQQAEANNRFAMGLTDVSDSSYDRMRNSTNNLTNRGLNTSGLANIVKQADTTAKGKEVLGLLENLGDVSVEVAESLKSGNEELAKQQADLNKGLGEALGDIGAAETQAQFNYNSGLADIAGSKDARDMENALQAAQRDLQRQANAASASASSGTSEIDEKLEKYQRNKAIASILAGVNPEDGTAIDWDDSQKASALKILFGIKNADDLVENFNYNTKVGEENAKYRDMVSKFKGQLQDDQKAYDKALDRYNNLDKNFNYNSKNNDPRDLINFNEGNFGTSVTPQYQQDYVLTYDKDNSKKMLEELRKLQGAKNQLKITQSNLDNALNKSNMTYQDLAEILFGE